MGKPEFRCRMSDAAVVIQAAGARLVERGAEASDLNIVGLLGVAMANAAILLHRDIDGAAAALEALAANLRDNPRARDELSKLLEMAEEWEEKGCPS